MVNRLAAEYPQHTIFCLDPVICPCSTMYRIHPGYLAWVLEAYAGTGELPAARCSTGSPCPTRSPSPPAWRWNGCWQPGREREPAGASWWWGPASPGSTPPRSPRERADAAVTLITKGALEPSPTPGTRRAASPR